MSPETAMWVDGAKLVRWLEDDLHLIDDEQLGAHGRRWERSVRAWKNEGRRAHIYTVDEFLCTLGVCLGEMPDEFWVDESVRGNAAEIDDTMKLRILKLWDLGWAKNEIAAIVGVGRDTVRRHVRKATA